MPAERNLQLFTPYLVLTLEGVTHGVYLLWLTAHRGISPVAAAAAVAAGDFGLLLLDVPMGVFADRLGARRSLVLGSMSQVLGLVLFWKAASFAAALAACLAIALGDAFRHGADAALVYRSCAAIGDAASFGRRFARAQAWALAAMVGLTAMGGLLAERAGFDVAWGLEIALAALGLAVALAMTEPPAAPGQPDDDDEGGPPFAGFASRLPWAVLVPATVAVALGSALELLAQTTPRAGMGASILALAIAGGLALEALGAALVARGAIPVRAGALDAIGVAAVAALGLVAIAPVMILPALLLVFLGTGAAPAIRSAILQARARDGERATVASAAGTVDMIGKTVFLPLAACVHRRASLRATVAVLAGASLLAWAVAARRRRAR